MKWRYVYISMALLLLLNFTPYAAKAGEITAEPICFEVVNTAPHGVNGRFRTDLYTTPDGTRARHTSNFRLDAAGTIHETEGYPLDRAEFCSYGPFYEGRKLEFVLVTLFPVFSCNTNVESGPIVIKSRPIESGNRLWAECFE